MIRKRAFDALRADVLVVDAGESLDAVADKLQAHLETCPDLDAVVVLRQGRFLGIVSLRTLLADLNDCALEASLRTSLGDDDFEQTYRDACRHCMARKAAEAARRDIPVVAPADPLHLVLDAMIKADSRFAVVIEGERLLGLVPLGEIFREMRRECAPL
ncbi:CBS domain containing protein [Solidesulfovibrio fructosivorans JJ]]|uniref:CBS domain containing protein n=1 Tax=Solidesulfovibrio fructosivorans JJ] TaxID=596151 RepID=E1JTV2_SOLFR|nr:CBS domain-containing protein [Solidesulfovibrio fructosivorans]EFL52231.1 CBS domain containing protein [Solidesulfovibrio fructosivorans JJ]]